MRGWHFSRWEPGGALGADHSSRGTLRFTSAQGMITGAVQLGCHNINKSRDSSSPDSKNKTKQNSVSGFQACRRRGERQEKDVFSGPLSSASAKGVWEPVRLFLFFHSPWLASLRDLFVIRISPSQLARKDETAFDLCVEVSCTDFLIKKTKTKPKTKNQTTSETKHCAFESSDGKLLMNQKIIRAWPARPNQGRF